MKSRKATAISDPVLDYARRVLAGEIVAGPHVRNACKRHLQDLVDGPKRGLRWDLEAAKRAIGFFGDVLRLNGGQFEGLPFVLHPSQAFIVGSIFGWQRANGRRRFRRAYIEVAKGNGKSPLAAGIGHYCLLADGEARAEVYAAAADKDQAMVLFRDAVAMRDQSPALAPRLLPSGGNPVWNLADLQTGGFFRPLSSEKKHTGSGPRPHCALCDEVHEHPDRLMIETLERGFKWRRQPLLVMTTNSGSDRQSVCWEEHMHAVRCAAGTRTPDETATYVGDVIDDETFGFVAGLDPGDDPLEDPACWPKANPLLGATVTADYLAGVVRQAAQIPGRLNGILRLHFCRWTEAETSWIGRAALEAVLADFDPQEHAGARVWLGLDLSASQDLTARALAAEGEPLADGRPTYDLRVEVWTPLDTLAERALRDQAPYDVWVDEGWLHAEPGRTIRMDFVAAQLADDAATYEIAELAFDRYAYAKLETELDRLNLVLPTVEHPQGGKRRAKPSQREIDAAKRDGREPQGLWMPGSVASFEMLVLEKRIRVQRHPLLIAAIMSAALERDPFDNRWLSKRKATNRIDAAVAAVMAIGAATAGGGDGKSVYETRGLLVI